MRLVETRAAPWEEERPVTWAGKLTASHPELSERRRRRRRRLRNHRAMRMAASCAATSLSSSSSSSASSASPTVFDSLAAPSLWQSCRRLPLSCHKTRRTSPLLRLHVSPLSLGRCAASAGPQPPPPQAPFPEESDRSGGGIFLFSPSRFY